MPNATDDAWKVFNRDTEAGRLLSRLYGVANTGRVTYPKQRIRRRANNAGVDDKEKAIASRSWKTTYTVRGWNKEAEEEKELERKENFHKALSVAVPKFGRGGKDGQREGEGSNGSTPCGIDQIPRRKTALTCRNTIEDTLHKKRHYRPPHSNNLDEEKKRLQNLTINANKPPNGRKPKANTTSSRPSTMFDQICAEIFERRKHQMEMEAVGAGADTRESTAYEIKDRLEKLKQLDSSRALAVVQKLMADDRSS